jgi:hypothetical protein
MLGIVGPLLFLGEAVQAVDTHRPAAAILGVLAAVAWSGVIWLKVIPAALYVDGSGVRIRNPFREVRLRWSEVAQFRLARMKRGAYTGALFVWVDSVDGTTTPVYALSERDPIVGSRPHFVERAVSELDRRLKAERVTAD